MVESNSVAGFLPSTHGLHFANRFAPGPTVRLGPIDPRWVGIGDASAGLCGGMSWYVRERFVAGLPVPPDTDPPANGSQLFKTLVRRQVLSLDWLRTPLRFWLMGALGSERAVRQTHDAALPLIRGDIDAGRLSMVGLVRHSGLNPFSLTQSHQVLAFSYTIDADQVSLRICDPNWPGRDDLTISVGASSVAQSSGESLIGLLRLA
jgi:hypothetical protein